jgi:hypothetical protein
MTSEQAKEQLKFHSGRHENINSSNWGNGFLPSLKPFTGLNRAAYVNLIECLDALKEEIQSSKTVDKELVLDLWTIATTQGSGE